MNIYTHPWRIKEINRSMANGDGLQDEYFGDYINLKQIKTGQVFDLPFVVRTFISTWTGPIRLISVHVNNRSAAVFNSIRLLCTLSAPGCHVRTVRPSAFGDIEISIRAGDRRHD